MIFPKKLKKDEINALPLKYYQGKIHLISSQDRSIEVCKNLINESVLGFDTETRPAFRKGEHYLPSLVQLAGENAVFIFQLEKTGMEPLKQILSNKNIIKCGVAINYDLIEYDLAFGFGLPIKLKNSNMIFDYAINLGMPALPTSLVMDKEISHVISFSFLK